MDDLGGNSGDAAGNTAAPGTDDGSGLETVSLDDIEDIDDPDEELDDL